MGGVFTDLPCPSADGSYRVGIRQLPKVPGGGRAGEPGGTQAGCGRLGSVPGRKQDGVTPPL